MVDHPCRGRRRVGVVGGVTMTVIYGSTTPFERGGMDSYYRRKPVPHKIVGTDKITDLTHEELVEYWKGYNENDDFKDWG